MKRTSTNKKKTTKSTKTQKIEKINNLINESLDIIKETNKKVKEAILVVKTTTSNIKNINKLVAPLNKEIDKLKKEVDKLRKEKQKLEKELDNAKTKYFYKGFELTKYYNDEDWDKIDECVKVIDEMKTKFVWKNKKKVMLKEYDNVIFIDRNLIKKTKDSIFIIEGRQGVIKLKLDNANEKEFYVKEVNVEIPEFSFDMHKNNIKNILKEFGEITTKRSFNLKKKKLEKFL